jgi:hypothetical protein
VHEKDTEELLAEIQKDEDMERFLSRNRGEFCQPLSEHLQRVMKEKGLCRTDVIRDSCLNPNYAYHILSGESTNPSRPKLLALAIAMKMGFDEIQYLLRYAGFSPLYPRNPWDAVVISAIHRGLSVWETDNLLDYLGETVLLGNLKKRQLEQTSAEEN